MKKRYLTLTIRKLKVKLSHVSRTAFRITRNFFKSRLGIDKRDWSRLTKAEIIRVLNYYYDCILGQAELVKDALTRYQFKSVSQANFINLLPKRKTGQQWRMIERVDIGELNDSGIPLFWFHFQIVYPQRYQLDIWDNPDCFMVVAEVGKQLYGYTSKCRLNVADFIDQVEQHYTKLLNDAIRTTRHSNPNHLQQS